MLSASLTKDSVIGTLTGGEKQYTYNVKLTATTERGDTITAQQNNVPWKALSAFIKTENGWKEAENLFIKVNDSTWKEAEDLFVKIAENEWKQQG
jgi:hypothetical protein